MRRLVAALLLLGASSRPALADDGGEGRRLLAEGRSLAARSKFAEAARKYAASAAKTPTDEAFFELGRCSEQVDWTFTAWKAYGRVVELAGTHAAQADERRRALTAIIPKIVVEHDGRGAYVSATIDGAPVAFDTELSVDPGHHTIGVVSARAERRTTTIDADWPGHVYRVRASDVAEKDAATPARCPDCWTTSDVKLYVPLLLVGSALAAMGVGAAFVPLKKNPGLPIAVGTATGVALTIGSAVFVGHKTRVVVSALVPSPGSPGAGVGVRGTF